MNPYILCFTNIKTFYKDSQDENYNAHLTIMYSPDGMSWMPPVVSSQSYFY